jgi:hypothetical protein
MYPGYIIPIMNPIINIIWMRENFNDFFKAYKHDIFNKRTQAIANWYKNIEKNIKKQLKKMKKKISKIDSILHQNKICL